MSTQDRDFPGFLPVGMRGRRGRLPSQVYQFPTARNLHYALMSIFIPSHKIINTPCQGGVVNVSNNTQQYYAGVQNACLQEYAKDALFESFPFSPKSYFEKYSNNKYFKHSTKSCLIIF